MWMTLTMQLLVNIVETYLEGLDTPYKIFRAEFDPQKVSSLPLAYIHANQTLLPAQIDYNQWSKETVINCTFVHKNKQSSSADFDRVITDVRDELISNLTPSQRMSSVDIEQMATTEGGEAPYTWVQAHYTITKHLSLIHI